MAWLLRNLSHEELARLVSESTSWGSLTTKIGLKGNGSRNALKEKVKVLGLDTSHFTGQAWNKGLTKDIHPSLKKQGETSSKNRKGKTPFRSLSLAHREAISRGCNERSHTNGLIRTKWFDVFNPSLGELVKVQGTWEKAYAEFLNETGQTWIRNRKIYFLWTKGDWDISHRYYPDFYLPGTDTYIEIKGFMWRSKDGRVDDQLKLKLVQNQNPNVKLIILMKSDLLNLGIKIP